MEVIKQNALGLLRDVFWIGAGAISGFAPLVGFMVAAAWLDARARKVTGRAPAVGHESPLLYHWMLYFTVPGGALVSGVTASACLLLRVPTSTRLIVCTSVNVAFGCLVSAPLIQICMTALATIISPRKPRLE